MKPPKFWQHKGLIAQLLEPLGLLYGRTVQRRLKRPADYVSALPVICVGNIVMGGSGKTPVVQALAKLLQEQGQQPAILLRGYGGEKKGPCWISEATPAHEYGDEALLHARVAPTMVSADRVIGARAIETNKAVTQIIMDDGLQNPSLQKNLSVLVVDGANPSGNGLIFPAGPLRETIYDALRRVQAIVVVGEDTQDLAAQFQFLMPVFRARLRPLNGDAMRGKPCFAFAGIGRPEKFFQSLRDCDAVLIETHAFPDHYPYTPGDLAPVIARARKVGAEVVTTRKDWVRLPSSLRDQVLVLDVALEWDDAPAVRDFLQRKLTF